MNVDTQNHLHQLRELLDFRLRELQADAHAAELLGRDRPASDREVGDWKDEASRLQQDEIDAAEEQRDVDELTRVRNALQRLDDGVYGDCIACGEPIALQRLLVQPAALRCADCEARYEHGQHVIGVRV